MLSVSTKKKRDKQRNTPVAVSWRCICAFTTTIDISYSRQLQHVHSFILQIFSWYDLFLRGMITFENNLGSHVPVALNWDVISREFRRQSLPPRLSATPICLSLPQVALREEQSNRHLVETVECTRATSTHGPNLADCLHLLQKVVRSGPSDNTTSQGNAMKLGDPNSAK